MKLGTLLLRNAAIGLGQLEAALRNQVLYGGRLGTNLVELGFLDLELLSAYLAELSGHPAATPALLDDADRLLLDKLGADDAHRLRAIPLTHLDKQVGVAMVDADDTAAIALIAARLGGPIQPYVVPELRALYYLEKLYGTPRRARFIRTGRAGSEPPVMAAPAMHGRPTPAAAAAEASVMIDPTHPAEGAGAHASDRRRQQPAGGIALPPQVTLEPRRKRTSQMPPLMIAPAVPASISFAQACERIDQASHRELIAEAFAEYAKGRCDALVVFLVRDGNALGWRGYVAPPHRLASPVEELSLPLGGTSALQAAHDAATAFLGPASPSNAVEATLFATLGAEPPPADVLVVPVLVKQRTVNLVYAHTFAGAPAQLARELGDLATRAQASYMRLIRQARNA